TAGEGSPARPKEGRRAPPPFLPPHHTPRAPLSRLRPPARPQRRERRREHGSVKEPPRRQGDDRLPRGGPARLPEAQPDQGDAARRRGPRPGGLRPDQPGLLPAPQADPGVLRVRAVPLAVPSMKSGKCLVTSGKERPASSKQRRSPRATRRSRSSLATCH